MGFTDPEGPRLWRVLAYMVPLLILLFAIFGPLPGMTLGVGAIGLFNLIGLVGLRQQKPRTAEIACGPGYVDVKMAGSRNQRVSAKDISGATTARTAKGLLLTLQHKKRDQPITLELQDESETELVRQSLGIGHGGFGTIAWRTQTDNTMRTAFVGRLLATIVALVTVGIAIASSEEGGLIAGMFFGQLGILGAALGLVGFFAKGAEPSVVMGGDGLRVKTPRGWFALPYEAIQHIEDHRRGLVFSVPAPYNTVAVEGAGRLMGGPSKDERHILLSQIHSAVQRARGLGPHKTDVTGRVDVLRRNGESARDWLVRLDLAGQMLSTTGYRGNTLDTVDLWAILEDPEAEPELRAAAARVLRHAPNTRTRIDAAVAAVRDESTNHRLRIAIQDDIEGASQELTFLDARESTAQQLREQQAMRARAMPIR